MNKLTTFFKKIITKIKSRELYVHTFLYSLVGFLFLFILGLAVIPQKGFPYDKVAIRIFDFEIVWYALFIMTGIISAIIVALYEVRLKRINVDDFYTALLICVVTAILGARLYYVFFDFDKETYPTFLDIINIRNGGLAIHGAIIFAIIFAIICCKWKKINIFFIFDILLPGFLIGQIIGRWGNFMNGELYGPAIESGFLLNVIPKFILNQTTISGVIHHPTFLYEGIWNFVGLVLLLFIRKNKYEKLGDLLGLYLIWYGFGRAAIIEPLRVLGAAHDSLYFGGVPINILLSYVFVVIGIIYLILKRVFLKNLPSYKDFDGFVEKTKKPTQDLENSVDTNDDVHSSDSIV
ncbi:MAG: prolipoprotein diacylglyceryl transferase [Acholeplasmatales bacterium]|nr:prolipoprotein diacylglyceryl transferase [Acholeplasmatales bacterium]